MTRRLLWLGVLAGVLSIPGLAQQPERRSQTTIPHLLPTERIDDEELASIVTSTRRLLVSSCVFDYPNVFVFQRNGPGIEASGSSSCVRQPLYVGISSCDSPSRQAAYRLPARCGWRVYGPDGLLATESLPLQAQPKAAVPGKSAVFGVHSRVTDPSGNRYQEAAQVLVSLDGIKVLDSEHYRLEP